MNAYKTSLLTKLMNYFYYTNEFETVTKKFF